MRVRPAGTLALLGCIGLLVALALAVHGRGALAIDTGATAFLHGLASPPLDAVMQAITTLGATSTVVTVLLAALLVLAWHRHGWGALLLGVAMAGTWALVEGLKAVVDRSRPEVAWAVPEPGGSFPSGHVLLALILGVSIALVATAGRGRCARAAAIGTAVALAALVGVSRVYLGQHHLTDVVGALVAGGAWLLIVAGAFAGGSRLSRPAVSPGARDAGGAPR